MCVCAEGQDDLSTVMVLMWLCNYITAKKFGQKAVIVAVMTNMWSNVTDQ